MGAGRFFYLQQMKSKKSLLFISFNLGCSNQQPAGISLSLCVCVCVCVLDG